jgi:hypothetical protein
LRQPLEQKLDAVPVDAVTLHDETDQRIANEFGERAVCLATVAVDFPVHHYYPNRKLDASRIADSWEEGAGRTISELATGRRRSCQPLPSSKFPRRSPRPPQTGLSCVAIFGRETPQMAMRLEAGAARGV